MNFCFWGWLDVPEALVVDSVSDGLELLDGGLILLGALRLVCCELGVHSSLFGENILDLDMLLLYLMHIVLELLDSVSVFVEEGVDVSAEDLGLVVYVLEFRGSLDGGAINTGVFELSKELSESVNSILGE